MKTKKGILIFIVILLVAIFAESIFNLIF